MKKWKQAMGVALAVCVMAGAANAARAEKSTVTASLYPDCHIVIDGVDRTFYNVSGEEDPSDSLQRHYLSAGPCHR